jgi:uncharacterized protein (UPF0333 family)
MCRTIVATPFLLPLLVVVVVVVGVVVYPAIGTPMQSMLIQQPPMATVSTQGPLIGY